MSHDSLTTELRLNQSSLHSRFYRVAHIQENVCCLRVSVETFVDSVDMESALRAKSVSTNPHLYRNMC
jgi:hypothetical protein